MTAPERRITSFHRDAESHWMAQAEVAGLSLETRAAYDDARLRGLCHEGALEVARSRPDAPATS